MKTPPKEYFDFLKTYGKEITDIVTTPAEQQHIRRIASKVRKATNSMLRYEAAKLRVKGYWDENIKRNNNRNKTWKS